MEPMMSQEMEQTQNAVVSEIKRSENDVYRISQREYKGKQYVDIRIFFRSKEDPETLIATSKGLSFSAVLVPKVIEGLESANELDLPEKPEGGNIQSIVVSEIPLSETETIKISKGSGSKNAFVDIRKFFKKDDGFRPYKKKGVSIQMTSLREVLECLKSVEVHS